MEKGELGVARLVVVEPVRLAALLAEEVLELLDRGRRAALDERLELAPERLGLVVDGLDVGVAEVLDGGAEGVDAVLQERVGRAGGVAVRGGEVAADGLLRGAEEGVVSRAAQVG